MVEIGIKVKTLDSNTHEFTTKDDVTVLDFKKKIEPIVAVESNRQRLIYCGKVLVDEKKLSEYELNGKTVHLVLRAPHSTNSPRSSSSDQQPRPSTLPPSGTTVYGGQWTIAWPPPGQWPPIVIRGAPVVPGQHPTAQRSRSATPSTTQPSTVPTTNVPTAAPNVQQPRATVTTQSMTIPIGQWTLGWPPAASGSWGLPPVPPIRVVPRQRTNSGPTPGTPTTPTVPTTPTMEPPQAPPTAQGMPNGNSSNTTGEVPPNTGTGQRAQNSYLLGAFQVPQDIFDPGNLTQIVQDVMSQLGVLGRNATVMSRTSEDGSAVDVHINLGQIASNNEIRNRISVIRRLLRGLSEGLDQLDQSLSALDGTGPPIVPTMAPMGSVPAFNTAGQPMQNVPAQPNVSTAGGLRQQPVVVGEQVSPSQSAVASTSSVMTSASTTTNSNKENNTTTKNVSKVEPPIDTKVTSAIDPKVSTTPSSDPELEFFDADDESVPMASGSSGNSSGISADTSSGTLLGTDSWHREVPSSWIPIISNDVELQRRNHGPSHEPLSEAYLNVLPKKKRRTD